MRSLKLFNQKTGRIGSVVALLIATIMPALVPALAFADTVTERSVTLSSSTKATTGVKYTVSFKTPAATASTGAFVVDFCTDAAVGTTCTTPTGLDVTTPTTTGSDTVSKIDSNTVKVVLNTAVTGGNTATVEFGGLTNPTSAGTIYARIVTYVDATAAGGYTDAATLGTYQDNGSVALQITDGFSVSGTVPETLTFCAARSDDTIGNGCTGTLHSPSVTLGTGGILADTPSEGTVKTQISTNAAGGASVWLKNSTAGGGLKRPEATTSDITPFYNSGVAAADIGTGTAKFGLKLGNLSGGTAVSGAYTTSGFFLDYKSDNSQGVTSAYGSQIFDTGSAPISNGTADLTFAANLSNVTPAGSYSAALSLIATGKF